MSCEATAEEEKRQHLCEVSPAAWLLVLLLALQQPWAAWGACTSIPHDRVFSPRNTLTSAEEAISLAG